MDRKKFLGTTTAFLGASALAPGSIALGQKKDENQTSFDLSDIPIFCGHEHWGSIFAIGYSSTGFLADVVPGIMPERKTSLVDLILDPYNSGFLGGAGINPREFPDGHKKVDIIEKAANAPLEAFKLASKALKEFQLKGTYQCLRLGIDFAYDFDISEYDQTGINTANSSISNNYGRMFSWYKKLMKKANLSELIRPVQPEFYFGDFNTNSAQEELSFTTTLLRIDPLLKFWEEDNSRRENLSNKLGIDPIDVNSWREFLEKLFTYAAEHSCIGIKQLQAYSRNLDFEIVKDKDVKFRGKLSETEVKTFQDWVMHECCRLANSRKWPHQIHVGTNNLPNSNPLPLERLAKMYPDQKIVMLHCWPYFKESGYLAMQYSNVYIDTCWQQILNPEFLTQSLETWLGYIPLNKITMSNDSTSIEMAVGSSIITRQVLTKALLAQKKITNLNEKRMMEIAAALLYNNAVNIYEIGKLYK